MILITQDLFKIKQELVFFLRNQDIISTSGRGVTTTSDTGTFSGANTHTLGTSPTLMKNIRSITVDGSGLSYGSDWSVNRSTGVITFTSPVTGAYTISYDYGSTDRIFPDFPQAYLKLNQFPRIAVDIISGNVGEISIGASTTRHAYDVSITCYSTGVEQLEDMVTTTQTAVLNAKKDIYYLKLLTPTRLGPILNSPNKQNKVLQRNIDFLGDFNFETV